MIFSQKCSAHYFLHPTFFSYGKQQTLLAFRYMGQQTGKTRCIFFYDVMNSLCQMLSISSLILIDKLIITL